MPLPKLPNIDPSKINIAQPDHPSTHISNILATSHNVINVARPGSSNMDAINRAVPHECDLLIWFHTESLRDYHGTPETFRVRELSRELAIRSYFNFRELQKRTGAESMIIGGQAPVYEEEFLNICRKPLLFIPNWHEQILGVKIPFVHWLNVIDIFEMPGCLDDTKDRLEMLEQANLILDLDARSDAFPDNAHPGKKPHAELAKLIDNSFPELKRK